MTSQEGQVFIINLSLDGANYFSYIDEIAYAAAALCLGVNCIFHTCFQEGKVTSFSNQGDLRKVAKPNQVCLFCLT